MATRTLLSDCDIINELTRVLVGLLHVGDGVWLAWGRLRQIFCILTLDK